MARNLAQRLDRLERLAAALLTADTSPVYLREGEAIPEGIDPERVVFIVRTFVEPPARVEDELPATQEPIFSDEGSQRQERRQPLEYPPLGVA
jgi:UDP-glucose 6-dehydrogenase